jgi:hypothetical protein
MAAKDEKSRNAPDKVRSRIAKNNIAEVSRLADIDQTKFWRWLNGKGTLFYSELFAVCQVLKLSIEFVLDDEQKDTEASILPTTVYEGRVIRTRNAMPPVKPAKASKLKRNPANK